MIAYLFALIVAFVIVAATLSEWQLYRRELRAYDRRTGKIMRRRIAKYSMGSNVVHLDSYSRKVS